MTITEHARFTEYSYYRMFQTPPADRVAAEARVLDELAYAVEGEGYRIGPTAIASFDWMPSFTEPDGPDRLVRATVAVIPKEASDG